MGKGSTIITKLNPEKKYYNEAIDDPAYTNKNFVIVPLYGWDDKDRFYYLSRQKEGLEIMGEFYICSKPEALATCNEAIIGMEQLKFHVTKSNGESMDKSDAQQFLKDVLGNEYSDYYLHNN